LSKIKFFIGLAMLCLCLVKLAAPAWSADAIFAPLRGHLISQGFSAGEVDKCLSDPALKFEGKVLAKALSTPESALNYGQFLAPASVARARKFSQAHQSELEQAARRTGVPASVVVAILSVETQLGAYTGDFKVFNVLASQAVLDTDAAKKRLAKDWPRRGGNLNSPRQDQRLARRAAWARGELPALLRLAQSRGVSPFFLKGSSSGAMGMCQFVPTSLEMYGTDGDRDGRVDLAGAHDAIMSIGTYLKRHGWRPGLNREQQINVILKYNKSLPYARTVLDLGNRLQ